MILKNVNKDERTGFWFKIYKYSPPTFFVVHNL